MSAIYVDTAHNFHPFECEGPGTCIHCDRVKAFDHNPATCALCDPEYDMSPNEHWPAGLGGAASEGKP